MCPRINSSRSQSPSEQSSANEKNQGSDRKELKQADRIDDKDLVLSSSVTNNLATKDNDEKRPVPDSDKKERKKHKRSRSPDSGRHKSHHKHRHRSRSRSSSKHHEKHHSKRYKRHKSQSKSVDNKSYEAFFRYYQNQIIGPSQPDLNDNVVKQDKFWDGFQWITKTQQTGSASKEARSVLLQNLPADVQFSEQNLIEFLNVFMVQNYLTNAGNRFPVKSCQLNKQFRSAVIEVSSLEECNRLALVKTMEIGFNEVRISKITETSYMTAAHLEIQASKQAQVQAATYLAMKTVQQNVKDGAPIKESKQQNQNKAQ